MKALRNVGLALVLLFVLTAVPAMAEAYTWTDIARGEQTTSIYNSCVGEYVVLHLTWQTTHHITFEPAHGYHVLAAENLRGTGYGLSTGNRYVLQEDLYYSWQWMNDLTYPKVYTNKTTYHLIGLGRAEDLLGYLTMHHTINANNEMTAWVYDLRIECK